MFNPYSVLELDASATPEDVNKAYKRLALRFHPDKNLNNTANANQQMVQINAAYEQLTQEHSRSTPALPKYTPSQRGSSRSTPAPSHAKPSQRGTENNRPDGPFQEDPLGAETRKGLRQTAASARADLWDWSSAVDDLIRSFKNRVGLAHPTVLDDLLELRRHIWRTADLAEEVLMKLRQLRYLYEIATSRPLEQVLDAHAVYDEILKTLRPWVERLRTDPKLDLKSFARILASSLRLVRKTRYGSSAQG